MADQNHSDLLNRLLVRIYRGPLQYAVDCWPWSAAADAKGVEPPEQRAIEKMATRQQQFIARLVELLSRRRAVVDFGVYPDYSELHYVSLDYLIGKLIADEQRLVAELEAAQTGLKDDPEAAQVVSELLAAEKEHLAQLRDLAAKASAGASA
jgi:hypothetical protein